MRTSGHLALGRTYTRDWLKNQFGILATGINNGVFLPRGHESVWLFVTQEKTRDRTPYQDLLKGDVLDWDGQTSARTDHLVVEHRERGMELLLFYRLRKNEFPGCAFRYCGRVLYESHVSGHPSHSSCDWRPPSI
jgi:hypothetical protein